MIPLLEHFATVSAKEFPLLSCYYLLKTKLISTSILTNELKELKKEKEGLDSKLLGFQSASKDLDTLLGSQRSNKNKEGLGYSVVPPHAQVYSPPKKDMFWTRLPEFADDTITDYSRPSPSIKSNSSDLQSSNSSVSEHGESSESIMSKPMIKFVKAADCLGVIKNNKTKTARKVKYDEMYRNTTKILKAIGNQRNWNNLMNQRLASNFEFKNKACYECGSFDHLIKHYSIHQKQEMEKPVWNNARRMNHQNSPRISHPNLKRHMAPRKNLTRSGLISFNTAKVISMLFVVVAQDKLILLDQRQ
nr:retrotransposon Orf1 [Tanacetum cinerariifolium]